MGYLYFLSIPFVNAFNVSQVFIIPLLTGLGGVLWILATGRLSKFPWLNIDRFVLVFLFTVLVSVAVNTPSLSPKNVNHVFAIFAAYGVFYFGADRLAHSMTTQKVLGILFVGYMIATLFGIFEFFIVNFTSYNLGAIVFRPSVEDYTPGFLDIVLIRARSLFEESGYFAAYLAVLGPLMVYYLWFLREGRGWRFVFIVVTLASYFVAFSVSLFIFLPFAILLTVAIKTVTEGRLTRSLLFVYFGLGVIAVGVLSSDVLMDALFYRKFEGGSFEDRNQKFAATMEVMSSASWVHLLFGFGPGSYFNLGVKPAISVYLNYFRDLGVFGVSAYIVLTLFLLIDMFRDKRPLGVALFVSALVIQLFYISTPIYFLPHYFVPLLIYRMQRSSPLETRRHI
jgi:hypothetical protein